MRPLAAGAVAIVASWAGCFLPDKSVREDPPQACAEAKGLTAILGGGDCEACIATKCCDAAVRCAEEDACASNVECTKRCSASEATTVPPCFDECRTHPASTLSDELLFCSDTSCREECSIGTTFGCVGAYRWPNAATDVVTVQLRIVQPLVAPTQPYPTPSRIMPCRSSERWPCQFELARSRTTTADGLAVLELPTINPLFPGRDSWAGYFLIEANEDLRTTLLFQNRSEYRDREVEDLPIPSDSELKVYEGLGEGGGSDVEPGFVVGQVLDCRAMLNYGGAGLVVQITPEQLGVDPPGILYIPDVVPDPRLTSTPPAGRFLARNVPPGLVTFTVRRETDQVVIAEEQMRVEEGSLTVVGIYPGAAK